MRSQRPLFFATAAAIIFMASNSFGAPSLQIGNDLKDISGFWYTENQEGGVELYACGSEVCGRFHWLKENSEDNISRDDRNPDPQLRDRPLCHTQFMGGFTPDGKGHYTDGWIYSPRHGAKFSAEMTLVDHDTLDLHGYIFVPLLGESQTWKRAKSMPNCAGK